MTNLSNTIKVFCDGGSRGNPGPAACAFILYGESAGNVREKRLSREVARDEKYLGIATNNEAEYQAVIEALKYLSSNQPPATSIQFFLDSSLVASQLNGLFKVKEPRLRELLIKVREQEEALRSLAMEQCNNVTIVYSYIPRSQNQTADLLVNQLLDRYQPLATSH